MAVNQYLAFRRCQIAGDNVHRCRFSCSVRAKEAIDLAFFYGKTQVVDCYMVAIAFHQVFNLYQCSFLLVS